MRDACNQCIPCPVCTKYNYAVFLNLLLEANFAIGKWVWNIVTHLEQKIFTSGYFRTVVLSQVDLKKLLVFVLDGTNNVKVTILLVKLWWCLRCKARLEIRPRAFRPFMWPRKPAMPFWVGTKLMDSAHSRHEGIASWESAIWVCLLLAHSFVHPTWSIEC